MHLSFPALFVLILFACADATTRLSGETVSADYDVRGGEWSDGGLLVLLMRTFAQEGRVAFCGTWTTKGATALSELYHRDVLAAAVLYLGGTRITQGLAHLPRAAYRPDMTGASTACRLTTTPWQPSFAEDAPRVRFPPMMFEHDDEEGGHHLEFRETVVPRITR